MRPAGAVLEGEALDVVAELTERCGGKVGGIATIMELGFLNGRERLSGYDYFSLISY